MGVCSSSSTISPSTKPVPSLVNLEVWTLIIPYLNLQELSQLSETCKSLYALVYSFQKLSQNSATKDCSRSLYTNDPITDQYSRMISLLHQSFEMDRSPEELILALNRVTSINFQVRLTNPTTEIILSLEGIAAYFGYLDVAETIENHLEFGMYIMTDFDTYQCTPFEMAAMRGNASIVKVLLKNGAVPNVNCMIQACKSGKDFALPIDLPQMCDSNYEQCFAELIEYSNLYTGFNCLGCLPLLKQFLSWASSEMINTTDDEGFLMLERAFKDQLHQEAVLLLEHTHKVSSKGILYCPETLLERVLSMYHDEPSPVYLAVSANNAPLLKSLIEKQGCNINLMESFKRKHLLPLLAGSKNLKMLRILQENTKIMDFKQALVHPYEYPCLWYALPDKAMVNALLKISKDVNALPVTEICYRFYESEELMHTLIKHGMDVNKRDKTGNNIVWHLYQQNRLDFLKQILRYDCDLNSKSPEGLTLVEDACLRKGIKTIDTIVKLGVSYRHMDKKHLERLLLKNPKLTEKDRKVLHKHFV